ncbi:MAG: UvrD-helicase domain-containing protein, partial [Clostridia bacterium]
MLNFTDSQKKAIETAGKSLVVSAGAGSGKTTVLTQRIINKILSGTDIDDILVVTFTRAAAADLKEKLYCSLSAESAKDVENTRLSDMLFKVSSAKISTISSFCLELVRSNFAILGLSPSLRVADDIESKIMLGECLANCIDDFFEKEDADFLLLADNFGGEKSLKTLEEMIISIYLRMRAEPFWHASMISACKSHEIEAEKCKNEGYFATDEGKMFKKNTLLSLDILLKKANKLYDYAAQVSVSEANIYPLACLSESIDKICKKNYSSYDGLKASLLTFESPRINTKGIEKVAAEYIKSEKAAIKSRFDEIIKAFVFSESDIYNDYIKTINLNKSIKKVIFELDRVYIFEKNKRGICDFSDAEQLSLKLLCEKTESVILRSNVCQKVRNSFAEIYIDEYQDINRLQDMIFSLISKPENRFCVGDSKQSIYRFRAAEAEIFSNYIKSCNELPNDEVKAKIYLSENFRSSKSIIDYVNLIFEKLYTVQNVGIDYSNEKLICASLGTIDYPVQTTVFYNGESGEKSVGEAEANYIVSEIQKLHNGGVKYSDIAIICRSISGTYDAEKEFVKNKIPYYIEKDSEFLLKPEIMLAVSILKIIDNPTDDISLFSALRSPIFLFNAEEIYKEHCALTKGTNIDISFLNYNRLKTEGTFQWPVPDYGHPGTPRLFTDKKFYTPSGKAIFNLPDSIENTSVQPNSEFPFILTTGRIRDQWHTMTKT